VERCGPDSSVSGYGSVAFPCEHGDEPSGSIKGGKFLDCVIIGFPRTLLLGVTYVVSFYFAFMRCLQEVHKTNA
jgi:hypothetical protein